VTETGKGKVHPRKNLRLPFTLACTARPWEEQIKTSDLRKYLPSSEVKVGN
jgi:hypothetical protein